MYFITPKVITRLKRTTEVKYNKKQINELNWNTKKTYNSKKTENNYQKNENKKQKDVRPKSKKNNNLLSIMV